MLGLSQHSKELARERRIEGVPVDALAELVDKACQSFPPKKQLIGSYTARTCRCHNTGRFTVGWANGGAHDLVLSSTHNGAMWHLHFAQRGDVPFVVGGEVRVQNRRIVEQKSLELFLEHLEYTVLEDYSEARFVVVEP
jgi:hypothetical protein